MLRPRIVLEGELRKRLLLETVPLLRGKARGFTTLPLLERFETVGHKVQTLDGREAIVAHARAESGVSWKGFRILVDQIDALATQELNEPVPPGWIYIIDEISELLLHSRLLQKTLQEIYKDGRPFVATLGAKPASYLSQLKRMRGVVPLQVGDSTMSQAARQLRRALGLPPP